MYKISVIVPAYNVDQYIGRCIDSILSQTFTDFELILIDDGSKDCSGEICDAYANQYRNIRVIHQNNQGQAAARNRGVAFAKSEWIAFVDADDLIHPQYLEILYDALGGTNARISICHAFEASALPIDFFEKQSGSYCLHTITEQRLTDWVNGSDKSVSKYAYWTVWGKLIHKTVLEEHPFTLDRIYEDNGVVFKWLYTAGEIVFCDNTLYFYYVNSAGTTKSGYRLKRLDWLWAVQEQISFYKKVGFSDLERTLKKRYIWEAIREYEQIVGLLGDRRAAGKLRRHIIHHWVRNRSTISLCYSEKMEVLSRLYPKVVERLSAINKRVGR